MTRTNMLRRLAATLLLTSVVAAGVSGCIAVPYGGYSYGGRYERHDGYVHHPYDGWHYRLG